jgi:hypothetical protein
VNDVRSVEGAIDPEKRTQKIEARHDTRRGTRRGVRGAGMVESAGMVERTRCGRGREVVEDARW